MNLSVAIGMNQDAVLCGVCTAQRLVYDVVIMPPRYLRDGLGADWADASLFFPEVHEPTFPLQGLFHLYAKACFEMEFPSWIVGITVPFNLGVLFVDGCCRGQAKPVLDGVTILILCFSEEAPVLVAKSPKVAILHPLLAFLRVSPPCPSPQCFKDGRIDMDKGFLGRCVLVKVCPSPYFGIECRYQPVGCGLFVVLDDLSDVRKKRFHVFLRRGDKEYPVVLTYILSEEVKSFLYVRYPGLLFREFQSSLSEKFYNEWSDFQFQYLLRDSCNDEVVRITHQVDLLVHAFKCSRTGVWILLAKYSFQSIKRHIGKDGRDDTALWRTIFRLIEDGFVHVSCFQPFTEDGFVHWNMGQQPFMADLVEAGFDVPFQYPLWSGVIREHRCTLCHCIGTTPFLPEPVRVWVGQSFGDGVQSLQVQRLHRSIFHRWDTEWTFLPVRFRDIHPSQREGVIAPWLHLMYGHAFALWIFPGDVIDSWGVLALVFCHSSHSKSFAAERVGQQVLQDLSLMPLAFLRCLDDTGLQPSHSLMDRFPWDGMPVCRGVGGSTSRGFHRHLHRPLSWFSRFSRPSTPQGSQPACASGDVTTRIRPATGRHSLFPTPIPASPSVSLTASLPSFQKERYGFTTFHKVDSNGLGSLCSPVAFDVHGRVLTKPCTHYGAFLAQACQHLWLVAFYGVYREFTCVNRTVHPVPSPPDAGRYTVPSRFGCQSGDCGYIVRGLLTARYLAAVPRRILLMEQQVWSQLIARQSTLRHRVAVPAEAGSFHAGRWPAEAH